MSMMTAPGPGSMRVRSSYCPSVKGAEAATNRTSYSWQTVSGLPPGFKMRRNRPDSATGGQPSGRTVPRVSTTYSFEPPALAGTEMAMRDAGIQIELGSGVAAAQAHYQATARPEAAKTGKRLAKSA